MGSVVVIAGKLVVDEVLWCAHAVTPGSNQRAVDVRLTGGGQVWHTARAIARLGAPVRVTGWAGADADSARLREELQAAGVEDRLVAAGRAVRSTVLIGPDGDRAIVSRPGSGRLTVDALDDDVLSEASVLHIDAYALDDIAGDALISLAEDAHHAGIPISLEPPAVRRLDRAAPWLGQLPPLEALIGRPDEADAAARLLGAAPRLRVTHDGPHDVTVTGVDARVSLPVPPTTVATTGAGDRFAAGWLVACARGEAMEEALVRGVEAAQAHAEPTWTSG
ncbi:MAG: hypothetical protein GC156_15810 [Actinomycetales bacterium]|nr:hypothetical protein [Actinomycetales bacterium]